MKRERHNGTEACSRGLEERLCTLIEAVVRSRCLERREQVR